jgi:hypothetical protein
MKIYRLALGLVMLTACSTSSAGIHQTSTPDASVDTWTAQPDTFIQAADTRPSLPCNGACGAGTTCTNNVCVVSAGPEAKVGAEPQAGPEPTGKEQGPEPQRNPDSGIVANPDSSRSESLPCVGGSLGQPCCAGTPRCTETGVICVATPSNLLGVCTACGAIDQACCAGEICTTTGLACTGTPGAKTCTAPPPEPNRDGGTPEPSRDGSIPDITATSPDGGTDTTAVTNSDTAPACGKAGQACCIIGIYTQCAYGTTCTSGNICASPNMDSGTAAEVLISNRPEAGQETQPDTILGPCSGKDWGTVCRPSSGPCENETICDGISADCPPNEKVAYGTVCLTADGSCSALICDGLHVTCYKAGNQPNDTACNTYTSWLNGTCNGVNCKPTVPCGHYNEPCCSGGNSPQCGLDYAGYALVAYRTISRTCVCYLGP